MNHLCSGRLIAILGIIFGILNFPLKETIQNPVSGVTQQEQEPTPTVDRFAEPVMPENPTQIDDGRNLYYYHCMPCHGDFGQGLTDEFREAWVDDHQNCWASGCHGGRPMDEGFPIPKYVPAVVGDSPIFERYPTHQSLHDFLQSEHPPQNPGVLEDNESWALTAFLLYENGRISAGDEVGPELVSTKAPESTSEPEMVAPLVDEMPQNISEMDHQTDDQPGYLLYVLIGVLILFGCVLVYLLRRRSQKSSQAQPSIDVDP